MRRAEKIALGREKDAVFGILAKLDGEQAAR
jgi:hypothetical protein